MSEADKMLNKLIVHNKTERSNKEILNAVFAIYYQKETKIEEMKCGESFFIETLGGTKAQIYRQKTCITFYIY